MKLTLSLLLLFTSFAGAIDTPKVVEVKPEAVKEFKVADADSLAVREAQVAYLRAKTDTTTAAANEQAALQRLVTAAGDALKHAGADPEKQQLNEENGKFVIKTIPLPGPSKKAETPKENK